MQPEPIQVPLSFTGKTAPSRRTSRQGAIVGTVKAGSQASRMLVWYATHGFLSDTEMASFMGLPEARISARRSGLMAKGFVMVEDEVQGKHGAPVCRWRLTLAGHRLAEKLDV